MPAAGHQVIPVTLPGLAEGTNVSSVPTGAQRVPRTLVHCTGDGRSPISPDDEEWDYVELMSGHWPMLTAPATLADVLAAQASDA